jgi:nucleotide sugar dehydrogenase
MTSVPPDFHDRNICVMGLGYVGLTLATVMAEVGFRVSGIEIRDDVLALLKEGEPYFFEPGLKERLPKVIGNGNLLCTKNIPDDCKATVYVITVGTPLGNDGKVRLDMIMSVSNEIVGHLKENDLVVMRSTVRPGTTRSLVMPILERSGVDFDLAFCPERTIEGQALAELRQLPQIIGGVTMKGTVRAAQIFQFLTPTVVRVSDVETAEVIKMIDNAYRDVVFAYANEVARICDALEVSAAEVINAGKLGYSRINLPMPGLVGGPCLAKDPYILADGLESLKIKPEISMAARQINERQPEEVVHHLSRAVREIRGWPEDPVISLMGIAFKGRPATDDLRGTMARPILDLLKSQFPSAIFRGFDAVVAAEKVEAFGLRPCASLQEAMNGANLALILNNHPIFGETSLEELAKILARPGLIYDFWNNSTPFDLNLPEGTGYMALGSHGKSIIPWRKRG